MNKNVLIFGGTSGFGSYIADHLIKKKFICYCIGKKKNIKNKKNIKFIKFDILKNKNLNHLIQKIKNIDYVIYAIGDSFNETEYQIKQSNLKRLLFINLYFQTKFNNMLVKNYSGKKIKIISICSDSVKHLKAKPSYVVAKTAQLAYYKTQKKFFKSINFETCLILPGPLLFKNSYWEKIKLNNPKKFLRKKQTSKFFHPKNYFKFFNLIINSKKNMNGKIFKI